MTLPTPADAAAVVATAASSTIPLTPAAPSVPASTALQVLPATWPEPNALIVFGALLAFGVLGGLLAARARWLPTITGFMAVGLLVGPSGLGLLGPDALQHSRVLVDIALGLILFRLGTALHPWRALHDRALVVTSLAESLATFVLIAALLLYLDSPPMVAVLAATIAISSSPAVLIHVADELKAAGPALERAKTLVAANNVLSFVLFSAALPVALLGAQVGVGTSLALPVYQLLGAVAVGAAVAWVAARIAHLTRPDEAHFRFAIVVGAVMLTLGTAQALRVSGLFAALTLGALCRALQGRTRLTEVEFGGGGDAFFVILFVYAGANLHVHEVLTYAGAALAFVGARTLAKAGAVYVSGLTFGLGQRRSAAEGLLLVPMAGMAIGLVQTTHQLMPELGSRVSAIVIAAVAVFETVGPPLAAFALRLSGEAGRATAAPDGTPRAETDGSSPSQREVDTTERV